MEQYFLINQAKIKLLIEAADIGAADVVLEAGAGIGSVAGHIPFCKQLKLLELDKDSCRILSRKFPEAQVIWADAAYALIRLPFDKLISNLPFSLTDRILSVLGARPFKCAVMAIREGQDLHIYKKHFKIIYITLLEKEDFFPVQPFRSGVVQITPF